MQHLYQLALVFHICGLTIMAGTTVADFLIYRQFWKQLYLNKTGGVAVSESLSKLPVLFRTGLLLLVASGVTIMALTHGVFGEQAWFRIKFALVILIIVNGLVIGRRQGLKLRKLLRQETSPENEAELARLKKNLQLFHIGQLLLFFTIFVLSVFKFN
jgi:uncharacterized membrane protein SirB2